MAGEITLRGHSSKGREIYAVASNAGPAFDAAVLEYVRHWCRQNGHELSQRVVNRTDLEPGRGLALVIEGIPLITRLPDHEQPNWDFIAWSNRSPQPREGDQPISLDGRVRWYRSSIDMPDGTWAFLADAQFPDPNWLAMVRRFLDSDPQHIALFESTFNSDGKSTPNGDHSEIVVYGRQVMHLLTPRSTDDEIEEAWDSARGWGGDEKVGFLTVLSSDQNVSPGDELSDDMLSDLARRTHVIGMQAFDGEGILVWGIGEQSRLWIDGEE